MFWSQQFFCKFQTNLFVIILINKYIQNNTFILLLLLITLCLMESFFFYFYSGNSSVFVISYSISLNLKFSTDPSAFKNETSLDKVNFHKSWLLMFQRLLDYLLCFWVQSPDSVQYCLNNLPSSFSYVQFSVINP